MITTEIKDKYSVNGNIITLVSPSASKVRFSVTAYFKNIYNPCAEIKLNKYEIGIWNKYAAIAYGVPFIHPECEKYVLSDKILMVGHGSPNGIDIENVAWTFINSDKWIKN